MRSQDEIDRLLAEAEGELARFDARRAELLAQIGELRREQAAPRLVREAPLPTQPTPLTNRSSQEAKIALFRSLFRGREDVYARRFESLKTGDRPR